MHSHCQAGDLLLPGLMGFAFPSDTPDNYTAAFSIELGDLDNEGVTVRGIECTSFSGAYLNALLRFYCEVTFHSFFCHRVSSPTFS